MRRSSLRARAAVAEKARGFRERAEHVERGDGGGGLLERREIAQDLVAELDEKFVFERLAALIRAEDFAFDLLQLGRDETLARRDGLLAMPRRRDGARFDFVTSMK